MPAARPVIERLWEKIETGADWECWLWTGSRDDRGYGRLSVHNVPELAHRLVWEYSYGPVPEGLCVLHHCDNPPCCNPDCLFLGTRKDNNDDRDDKGRNGQTNKTHCPYGHPYSGDNLIIARTGYRECRTCRRARKVL
jgi:hypothetical protein